MRRKNRSGLMILVVGDRPSARNTNPDVAFIGAGCEGTLKLWLRYLEIPDARVINSHTKKLQEEIRKHPGLIIALGNAAYVRCSKYHDRRRVFKLPHPSGRNRQLNDKEFVTRQINTCRLWLELYKDQVIE